MRASNFVFLSAACGLLLSACSPLPDGQSQSLAVVPQLRAPFPELCSGDHVVALEPTNGSVWSGGPVKMQSQSPLLTVRPDASVVDGHVTVAIKVAKTSQAQLATLSATTRTGTTQLQFEVLPDGSLEIDPIAPVAVQGFAVTARWTKGMYSRWASELLSLSSDTGDVQWQQDLADGRQFYVTPDLDFPDEVTLTADYGNGQCATTRTITIDSPQCQYPQFGCDCGRGITTCASSTADCYMFCAAQH